jgi:hypothetical protein
MHRRESQYREVAERVLAAIARGGDIISIED